MHSIDTINQFHDDLVTIRQDIHAHPETAYEEYRTADIVAQQLQSLGIEADRGLGKTGVVGTLKSGTGNRAIALRADMDALNMVELNTFSHRSVKHGKMHGCGHDGHTTMLLGAARYLAKNPDFDGTVYFVFQPAEEGGGGADAMIKDGLFEKFPVESVWGMHNFPGVESGHFITRSGPLLASADHFNIVVKGTGGHGAMPHLARSPVNGACTMISTLNDFIAQEINTQSPTTLTIGRIHGGDATNVIPDDVAFAGTVRTFEEDNRTQVENGMRRICAGIAAANELHCEVEYKRNYPVLINSTEETAVAARAASKLVGEDKVNAQAQRIMGSEDFAFMLQHKPGNYIMIGNGAGELGGCMVHNPHYDFNDDILSLGASYWVELTRELLPCRAI